MSKFVATLAISLIAFADSNGYAGTVIYESAVFSPRVDGTTEVFVSGFQFLGARFNLAATTSLDFVGGHFGTSNFYPGTMFGAIVQLSGASALPTGSPFDGTTLATTTFSLPTGYSDFLAPISVTLPPGYYGLVFGGGVGGPGAFGATSAAFMPASNVEIATNASYFFWNQDYWTDSSSLNDLRFVVTGTAVPEVSSSAIIALSTILLTGFTRRRCRLSPQHLPTKSDSHNSK